MPDGYGDNLPSYAINLLDSKHGTSSYWEQDSRIALAAVARLCNVMSIGKKDTLTVLGLKKSNENYWWLQDVLGDPD